MAGSLETIAKYKDLLINLLPVGRLWQPRRQPVFDATLESIAVELCRVEDRVNDLLDEADPRNADELLEDWLRLVGLPDECTPEGLTTIQLRDQMVEKYTNVGGLSKTFYEAVGLKLGYTIVVDNYFNFRVGFSTCGEALTNYFDDRLEAGEVIGVPLRQHGWRFVFNVTAPIVQDEVMEAGDPIGQPLHFYDNELVRCTIQKLKPAHTSFTLTLIP